MLDAEPELHKRQIYLISIVFFMVHNNPVPDLVFYWFYNTIKPCSQFHVIMLHFCISIFMMQVVSLSLMGYTRASSRINVIL